MMGLQAVYPKKNLSKRNHEHKIFPYLLRDFPPQKPHDVWCTDITYIRTSKGFVYLTALIDVVSRCVMGFHLSPFLDTESCLNALEMAIKSGYSPKIINTDQGCQFTSQEWLYSLSLLGVQISMDGKGRCLDNIPIERFWRTLKYEEVYLKTYETVGEARHAITKYINWYNHDRRHSALKYHHPYEVMMGLQNAQTWPFQLDENVDNNHKQETQKRTYKNVIHNFTSSTTTKSKQKNMKKKTKLSLNLAA
jgi:putative transposase